MENKFSPGRFFSKFPNIDLGDIKLRDLRLSDSYNYYKLFEDKEVSQYLSDEDVPKTVEDALNDVKFYGSLFYVKRSVFWAIADSNNDELIGTIGFSNWSLHNRRAEISYDLMRQYWRKGIMTKALSNVLMFAFKNMLLGRIEARTMEMNIPSQKLLEKMSFKYEGKLRSYRIINGVPSDILLYSIIRNDSMIL